MTTTITYIALISSLSIPIFEIIVGLLSRKLGLVTHAPPYYLGFFVAAALSLIAFIIRFIDIQLTQTNSSYDNTVLVLSFNALVAISVTLALIIAWRYWSWLFVERD